MNTKPQDGPKVNTLRPKEVLEKLEFFQTICRDWLCLLEPAELVVLLAIADRTIMWGEFERRINLTHLIEGIPGHSNGVNMSERHFRRQVDSLIEKGLMKRTSGDYESTYSVQIDADFINGFTRVYKAGLLKQEHADKIAERINRNEGGEKT